MSLVDQIILDETNQQRVETLLGSPDTVVYNKRNDTTTYQYKYAKSSGVALPIPFFQFGKAAEKGYILNIVMYNKIVIDYELITMGTAWMFQD